MKINQCVSFRREEMGAGGCKREQASVSAFTARHAFFGIKKTAEELWIFRVVFLTLQRNF
jgi:hypothetical protein